MKQLLDLYKNILDHGYDSTDRTGVGTKRLIGQTLRFDLNEGFPATTTKKLAFKSMASELLWFIEGSTDERRLCEILHNTRDTNKNTIWTDNCKDMENKNPNRFNGFNVGNMYGMNWRFKPCEPHGEIQIKRKMTPEFDKVEIEIPNLWGTFTNTTHEILYSRWLDLVDEHNSQSNFFLSKSWRDFDEFLNDAYNLWGFQEFIDGLDVNDDLVLNCTYYGSFVFDKSTTIFIKESISEKLISEFEFEDPYTLTVTRPIIYTDQLQNCIDIIKSNPDSRRIVIDAWNPRDTDNAVLGVCHPLAQFFVIDNKLSCTFYMRSSDTFLGLPFNIASYALLVHMIANICNLGVGELIYMGGDCHIYNNHIDQVKLQLEREPQKLPVLKIDTNITDINDYVMESFSLTSYNPAPSISAPMAV